jgi:hypothetical protein
MKNLYIKLHNQLMGLYVKFYLWRWDANEQLAQLINKLKAR